MKRLILFLKILLIAVLITLAVTRFDSEAARDILSSANLAWALGAMAFSGLTYLFYSLRWKVLLRGFWPEKHVSVWRLFYYNALALFYTLFIPTTVAGETARIIKLSNDVTGDIPRSIISSVLDRLIAAVIWVLLFLFLPSSFVNKTYWLFLLPVVLSTVYLLRNRLTFFGHRVFDFSRHHPADTARAVGYSVIAQFFYVLSVHAVFRLFGVTMSLAETGSAVAATSIASFIPVAWLGISMKEGAYIALLPLYGVASTRISLVIAFLVFMNYVYGLSGGLVELAHSGWKLSRIRLPVEKRTNL